MAIYFGHELHFDHEVFVEYGNVVEARAWHLGVGSLP